jgi:transposase-like protein
MGEHRRKAGGRRVFSTEFKRATVQRILTGEKTLAELSRELDISPSENPQLEAIRGGRGDDGRPGQ